MVYLSAVDATKPMNVFIMSSGHSGSTLLNMILGTHSAMVAVGELTHLPKNLALDSLCSCGARISACKFWQDVIADVSVSLGAELSTDPYQLDLGYIDGVKVVDRYKMTLGYRARWKLVHLLIYARLARNLPVSGGLLSPFAAGCANTLLLNDSIRRVSGARIVVDASKSYLKGLGLYLAQPAATRLILLTRDGRANLYSRLRRGTAPGRSLRSWQNFYQRALPLLQRNVPDAHRWSIKYESLATHPEREIAKICDWLGVPYEPEMLEFRATVHHLAEGNRMRGKGDSKIQFDEAWKSGMRAADLAFFERHAGALNRSLGYPG